MSDEFKRRLDAAASRAQAKQAQSEENAKLCRGRTENKPQRRLSGTADTISTTAGCQPSAYRPPAP
jgi:hypothetical protein